MMGVHKTSLINALPLWNRNQNERSTINPEVEVRRQQGVTGLGRSQNMKTLVTLALLTSFWSTFVGKGEELLAGDLARALGIHWCVVQLPPADGPLKLRFVIQFSDGKRELSGAMGGFTPGSKVNAYFWPAEDSERLNVAITSETGVMRTTIVNPASSIVSYPVNAGATTELGSYIFKGSQGDLVTSEQELQNGEFGLFVDIKP